jgi:rubrerythrin
MAQSKKRTTMAKLMRENAVRERRHAKDAKKQARKLAAAEGHPLSADEPEPAGDEQELAPEDRAGAA